MGKYSKTLRGECLMKGGVEKNVALGRCEQQNGVQKRIINQATKGLGYMSSGEQ